MIENYAFISNNVITNIAVFEDVTPETLEHFKNHHNADGVVLSQENWVINGTWDGVTYTPPVVEEEIIEESPVIEEIAPTVE